MYIGTYNRAEIRLGDSPMTVIRKARKRIAKHARRGRQRREARHAFFREILAIHERCKEQARMFRL